jgi:hypothetical protein
METVLAYWLGSGEMLAPMQASMVLCLLCAALALNLERPVIYGAAGWKACGHCDQAKSLAPLSEGARK